MKTEERNLLLKDLCARLPYQVKVKVDDDEEPYTLLAINANKKNCVIGQQFDEVYATSRVEIERIRPYLRPMSSMTKEEKEDLLITIVGNEGMKYFQVSSDGSISDASAAIQDLNKFNMHSVNFNKGTVAHYLAWLNENHIDYLGSIGKGLAIEVTEENNPYKN